ncbi:MAG: DUF1203 domain-containing protein [Sphingomonas sp.]|nr:DUF1203 domain-containing protein [Sphingomonas sp.]
MTGFVITGLDPALFADLYGLDDATLAARGAERRIVDATPGFPCRITLEDAAVGTTVLLVNHEHLAVDTPYRQRHAVFVTEGAVTAARHVNTVPRQLAMRTLSVRAYDATGHMVDADLTEGDQLPALIDRLFADAGTAYLHAHNARPGCFAARIDRAE